MPVPPAVLGLLGAALGGGSQTTQNTTNTLANTNTFNPNIVFGGDSQFNPSSPLANDFVSTSASAQTQEQANPADLLSAFSPVGAAGGLLGEVGPVLAGAAGAAGVVSGATTSAFLPNGPTAKPDPLIPPSLALGAAALVAAAIFIPRKKKGR